MDDESEDSDSDSILSESLIVATDDCNADVDASSWVLVQSSDIQELQSEVSSPADMSPASELATSKQQGSEEQPQIYLRWDIQDQFLRFVAHALCAFYGLVSFSKTAMDGKRLVYICHPTHLDSIGQLATLEVATRKGQSTLEHVQELSLHELDQLWKKVEPIKLSGCLRPDMTFLEYLYPSTRPVF
ncbi:hypothetical protein BGZ65_002371 [Modicella reniformis]|uniref:Uncharacterized protein n=1 Tax=Modicella reniformis TaxID=1440133 RepID=A0A9P6LTB3_9FUNG|nr:hypothetical protein BGZ65_002371 [Modicella reniformis]